MTCAHTSALNPGTASCQERATKAWRASREALEGAASAGGCYSPTRPGVRGKSWKGAGRTKAARMDPPPSELAQMSRLKRPRLHQGAVERLMTHTAEVSGGGGGHGLREPRREADLGLRGAVECRQRLLWLESPTNTTRREHMAFSSAHPDTEQRNKARMRLRNCRQSNIKKQSWISHQNLPISHICSSTNPNSGSHSSVWRNLAPSWPS